MEEYKLKHNLVEENNSSKTKLLSKKIIVKGEKNSKSPVKEQKKIQ